MGNHYYRLALLLLVLVLSGCAGEQQLPARESKIPADAVKMGPETDASPPKLHSEEFETPVPFAPVNTAGAEDSPFVPADRDEFYFFYTPDVRVPVQEQVADGVTGIYMSKRVGGAWQEPERVMLQKRGKLAGDGCEFVLGNMMMFCTVREGYTGIHWFSAEYKDGKWRNWKLADFDPKYIVGELHITQDGKELYFHSTRNGGSGSNDIWVSQNINGKWEEPFNVYPVNTKESEGWPYVTPDGNELWFNRRYQGTPGVFRSKRVGGVWQEPELIVSSFAGEPTLDKDGNLYFVHHYYKDGEMIEADIYVAYRK